MRFETADDKIRKTKHNQ